MTMQEKAIEQLERISHNLGSIGETVDYTDIAIQALEQQLDFIQHKTEVLERIDRREREINKYIEKLAELEQQLSEDVLDNIKSEIIEKFDNCSICEWFEDYDYDENDISEYRWVGHISDIIDIIDKYRK